MERGGGGKPVEGERTREGGRVRGTGEREWVERKRERRREGDGKGGGGKPVEGERTGRGGEGNR